MASIVDTFNEALSEDLAIVKIAVYTLPVFCVTQLFIIGKMSQFYFWGSVVGVLMLGLLTQGINNVRMNKKEIFTLNPLRILKVIFKITY